MIAFEMRILGDDKPWEDLPIIYPLKANSLGEYLYLVLEYQGGPQPPIKDGAIWVNESGSLSGYCFTLENGKLTHPPTGYYNNRYIKEIKDV